MDTSTNHDISETDKQRLMALAKRLPAYLSLAKRLLADPNVPAKSKALLGLGGAYAISPIDLVPGLIPVAGQLDDAYVLLYGLRKCLTTMPEAMATSHLQQAGLSLELIDDDIALVISLAKRIARMVITTGAKIGRAGRTTFRFARDTVGRWRTGTTTSKPTAKS
jgi:uncharacterized membrane protein YkvA (DUF1232 family)